MPTHLSASEVLLFELSNAMNPHYFRLHRERGRPVDDIRRAPFQHPAEYDFCTLVRSAHPPTHFGNTV